MPTQLENYSKDYNGYTAIEPRIKYMKEKVEALHKKIEKNKQDTKKAIAASDVERKNLLIRERHLAQFEHDYWEKKYQTFTLTEMPNWWKNSQLVDTQIISKYARAYLKSYFNKVDVQKGTITAEFRKIYGIMGNDKKDRNKHSHHAIDAAVLTLIPSAAMREELLEKHFANVEKGIKNQNNIKPYTAFTIHDVLKIEKSVLINHVTKDQTLNETKKYVRKRGKIEYVRDHSGNIVTDEIGKKKKMVAEGMGIRGRLHQETNYGAIKAPLYNNSGFAVKENGVYTVKKEKGKEEMWVVVRKPIADISFDKDAIVDQVLAKHLKEQIKQGKAPTELVDFNHKPVRHIRCRVKAGRGFLSMEKAIPVRKHSHLSKQAHKQQVYVQNDTNNLFLFYEDGTNNVPIRESRIISLFEMASIKRTLNIASEDKLVKNEDYNTFQKGNNRLPLKYIIKVGCKAIFYVNHKEELKELPTQSLMRRLFKVIKFNEIQTNNLYLQNHIEATGDSQEDENSETSFSADNYISKLKLKISRCNFIVEHYDFNMHPDGTISFKF